MRVLLLHNRYRVEGGEERSVELQMRALENAGVEHRLLERRSADAGRAEAALAMLRGGGEDGGVVGAVSDLGVAAAVRDLGVAAAVRDLGVAATVRDLGADVVHAHNMQPLIGPRGLAAA